MDTSISQNIKTIRSSLGLTQFQLAILTGLTRSKIADYETGRSRIAAEDYLKIQRLGAKNRKRKRMPSGTLIALRT